MRSIADQLRAESRMRDVARTPQERMEIAFRLGDDDLRLLCAARGLTIEQGRALIRRVRQVGRRRSIDAP